MKKNMNNKFKKLGKMNLRFFFLISIVFIVLILNLIIVSAADEIYVNKYDNELGKLTSQPIKFNSAGEIDLKDDNGGYFRAYLDKDLKNSIGYVKNVKIKKDANGGVIVEIRENGELSRFGEDGKERTYNNIKPGGIFSIDSKSELIKAKFETTKAGNYYLNGFIYELSEEGKFNYENKQTNIVLQKQGSIKYYAENTPEKKKTLENVKAGGDFTFNEKGELVKAKFEVSAETDLNLKGYKYKLAANSKVDFDKNKVDITLPDGTKLSAPEKVEGETVDPDFVFSFSSESGKGLSLPSGDIIENKNGKTVINYKDGFYVNDKSYVVKNNDKEDFLLNTNGKDTYLYSDDSKVDDSKSYVLLGKDKLISSSKSGEGASLFILPGNHLGIKTTIDNTISIEGKNGKAIIERSTLNEVPPIKLSGESITTLDKRSFSGAGGELYFDPKKVISGDFNNGKYSASAKVSLVDDSGKNLKNFDVYSNNLDQYAAVSEKDLKSSFKYYKTAGGFFVSSSLTFNQLSYDAQKFYDSLDTKRQQEIAGFAKNGEKAGAADLQGLMKRLIDEEIKIRQNPVKASVRIHALDYGVGGSGTVVGVDKDGYPIVMTAGHVISESGARIKVDFVDGKSYQGTVIAGIDGMPADIALIRLNTKIPGVSYVPVASQEAEKGIGVGQTVMRIGTPNLGKFRYTNTQVSKLGGQISTAGKEYGPIMGESGGGIFSKGRLVGITSRAYGWGIGTGGYTSPSIMRNFLQKYGLGNLASLINIFQKYY